MSGTLKVGGKTLATHDTNTNVAKIQLGSTSDVVLTDSAGNNVLSESGSVVTLTADEANVGSNALVVDSSGKVGIGTSSPSSFYGTANNLVVFSSGSTSGITIHSTGDSSIYFADGTSGSDPYRGIIQYSHASDALRFYTAAIEKMRIDSIGNVLVNATSTSGVDTGGSANEGVVITPGGQIQAQRDSDAALYLSKNTIVFPAIARFAVGGSIVGRIEVTSSSTSYVESSDYRLKENITEITDGITRVKQLNPSRFNFIADPDKIVDGFIAHEVQDVVPEAISGEKDAVNEDGSIDPQGIDQSKLVPLLTAALQEAISKIEDLTARIEALETPAE